jgi:hypothetical protein
MELWRQRDSAGEMTWEMSLERAMEKMMETRDGIGADIGCTGDGVGAHVRGGSGDKDAVGDGNGDG